MGRHGRGQEGDKVGIEPEIHTRENFNDLFLFCFFSVTNAPVRGIGEQPVDGHIHFFQTLRSYWGGRMQADRWSKREKFPNNYFTLYSSQTLIETF